MSGWGLADKKVNKLVIGTDDGDLANKIYKNALNRQDFKYVNLNVRKPRYNENSVYISYHDPSPQCIDAIKNGDQKYIY